MTTANDSILVTPGTGATVATHLLSSKEYQAVVLANGMTGHIAGTELCYWYDLAEQVHVAAASTVHWDLFNADAALLVRVLGIYQRPSIITAVTGVATNWSLDRTTAVGTGGSAQTARLADLSQTALSASITCRSKPTGGATSGAALRTYTIHSEETNAASQMMHMMMAGGVANILPPMLACKEHGLVLRNGQGVKCTQTTNSAAGNTGWCLCFTVEAV
jgi:hypothetical protein